MTDTVYSFDSSALIHAWGRAYRPKSFPTFWAHMDELATGGRLKISSEVYEELSKKDDDVFNWAKLRKADIYVDITDAVQDRVIEIMSDHPRLVDTKNGKSGGDPFVIALASCGLGIAAVVTQENPGGDRIPQVCDEEGIPCMNLADFIEVELWVL
jgi:hypothetical protein